MRASAYDAIVLAGGAAQRFGGRDKLLADVAGVPLLHTVVEAVAQAGTTVVVGPERPLPRPVVWTREDPPGGGPAAGVAAALPLVTAEWVAVLAGDLPFLEPLHVGHLLDTAQRADGAVLVDGDGREQWLAGVWRTAALRALPWAAGQSVRRLAGPLRPYRCAWGSGLPPWRDVDTRADLDEARSLSEHA